MSLDTLLGTVRTKACLGGPLGVSGNLYDSDGATAHPISAMLAAASPTVQLLQGQGVISGRRATLMVSEADVTAAFARRLRRGDEFRVASGSDAGRWIVEDPGLVRGGWESADVRLETVLVASGAQEVR